MTHLLITANLPPFTAEDIRDELGLDDDRLDPVIEGGIAVMTFRFEAAMRCTVRQQVWAVSRTEFAPLQHFYKSAHSIGTPSKIGPAYRREGCADLFHDVEYLPDFALLSALKARIVDWALDQDDIAKSIRKERYRCRDIDEQPVFEAVADALGVHAVAAE